jgi:small subunit ribosomal protein S16
MISIRLSRVGRKNAPMYRLVVMPKHRDPWAKTTEILGTYNPRTKETAFKADRIKDWIAKGAEVSDTAWNLLVDQKIVTGKKRSVTTLTTQRQAKLAEAKKAGEAKAEAPKAEAAAPAQA